MILGSGEFQYKVVEGWGRGPTGCDNFGEAIMLAVDSQDRVHVLSRSPKPRVFRFDRDGVLLTSWGEDVFVDVGGVHVGLLWEGPLSAPVEYASGPDEPFERSLTLGAALRLDPMDDVVWNISFQASRLFAASAALAMGLEAWIGGVGARVGFDGTGATFGLSVRFTALQIDWAYAGRLDLGDSHRVSLTLRF